MMIEYDPDKKPEMSEEGWRTARENGLHPVQLICEEPNAKVGDHTGVTCLVLVSFVPRVGERVYLEDKTVCEVDFVRHSFVTVRDHDGTAKYVMLVPIVHATMVRPSGGPATR